MKHLLEGKNLKRYIVAGLLLCAVLALGCIGQKTSTQSVAIEDKYTYNFGWKVKCLTHNGDNRYVKLPDNFFNMNTTQFDRWCSNQNLADSEYDQLRHNTIITQGNVYKSGCLEGAC